MFFFRGGGRGKGGVGKEEGGGGGGWRMFVDEWMDGLISWLNPPFVFVYSYIQSCRGVYILCDSSGGPCSFCQGSVREPFSSGQPVNQSVVSFLTDCRVCDDQQ